MWYRISPISLAVIFFLPTPLPMFDPKTPQQAGLIFAAGLLVIAWTTLDIQRVTKQNEQPLSEEQLQALQRFGDEAKQKAFGKLLAQIKWATLINRVALQCSLR